MVKTKASYGSKSTKATRSGRSFTELMRGIDIHTFSRMVMKSGLSGSDARELCDAFREFKG